MGGSAFADPKNPSKALHTPRMPPHVYRHIRDRALRILRTFYTHAQCPIEAPGKADYGDVDILVASPHVHANTDAASIFGALGATHYKMNSPTTNYALPWPTVEELNEPLSGTGTGDQPSAHGDHADTNDTEFPRHIQLDLHVCSTPERFEWELFHQAHGDLWSILGGMIRPYGVIVNQVGLYLRLAGVENISKKERTIQLTTSPSAVLKFLELEESTYWTPFESLEAMFAYAASCRFYDPKAYQGKEDLKANDRQRLKKRPIFRKWYDVYLPEHRDDEPGRTAGADREAVIEEAKRVFDIEREYEEKRAKGLRKMDEEKLWSNMRKGVPVEGLQLGVVIRGVKREVTGKALETTSEVMGGEERQVAERTLRVADAGDGELSDVRQAYADGRFDDIAEWVKTDWENIERRQRAFEREQSTKHLLAKLERDRVKAAVDSPQTEGGMEDADL